VFEMKKGREVEGWEKEGVFEMKKGREGEGWEKEGVFEMKKGREVEGWEKEGLFEIKREGSGSVERGCRGELCINGSVQQEHNKLYTRRGSNLCYILLLRLCDLVASLVLILRLLSGNILEFKTFVVLINNENNFSINHKLLRLKKRKI